MYSIIIPTYNSSSYIHYALDSIEQQDVSLQDLEVIIIDDNSLDQVQLAKVIKAYENKFKIILQLNSTKTNGAMCRNQGLKLSTNNIICFLDADDYWSRNKLSAGKKILQQGKKRVVYGALARGTRKQIEENKYLKMPIKPKENDMSLAEYWWVHNGITQTSSLMFYKADFTEIIFNPNLERHQDYDFCLQLEKSGADFCFDYKSLTYWVILDPNINAVKKGASLNFCINWLNSYNLFFSKKAIMAYIAKDMLYIAIKEKNIKSWFIFVFTQKYTNSINTLRVATFELIKKIASKI
ncbi:glycosyltransferase family 2 protein [Providencia rettgeri]|nr:glycosyltransferase family 2 protein [Providencia rettgeri]